jgi:2,3-diketo-5-methylthio-1-phosphopentane phosphatase
MRESVPQLYLLDVEGTIAPLTLTTGQLFPYARKHFAEFLEKNSTARSVQEDLLLLIEENLREVESGAPRIVVADEGASGFGAATIGGDALRERALAYLLWLMDRDRKSTALKSLQGKVWKAGFESGELKGMLFADVPGAIARWAARDKVAIYSSGSVEAQKLLFGHTIFGDLRPLIAGYFDTRTGPKMESASYAAIAKAMEVAPGDAVFFSDVVKELDAAREAGMQTRLMVREGNAVIEDARGHGRIGSFDRV